MHLYYLTIVEVGIIVKEQAGVKQFQKKLQNSVSKKLQNSVPKLFPCISGPAEMAVDTFCAAGRNGSLTVRE